MADAVKAQKLAAARKRLKEYQKSQSKQKNDKNNDDGAEITQKNYLATVTSENVTPAESMTSSTHSAFDNIVAVQENTYFNQESGKNSANNYICSESNASFFNKALFQQMSAESNHILSNYFVTRPQNTNTDDTVDVMITSQNSVTNETVSFQPNENMDKINQNVQYADPFEFVEQKQDNIIPSVNYVLNENILSTENIDSNFAEPVECKPAIFSSESSEDSHKNVYSDLTLLNRTKSECALSETTSNVAEYQNVFSNTESLRQLSSQLNSLISSTDTSTNINESPNELERRNQELAELLKIEQTKTEQLNLQTREYLTRIAQLESETTQIRNEHEAKLSMEIGPLQEQLDYHMKAFGILVGERTELQMALTQSQTTAKQKTSECEELQGRLKASRHRVSELEKEVNHFKSVKDNLDKYDQENNREFERLRLECNLVKEQFEEATEESSELKEKLNGTVNECLALKNEIQEKNSQLSLSQLKLQQLTNGENVQVESQIEILNQQKIYLEHQISELTQTVKTVSLERDQASQQYQQYVQQLNGQIQSLAEKLETKNGENGILANREQSLVKHIGELEKHLQQLQTERQNQPAIRNDSSSEIQHLEKSISALQAEKVVVEGKYQDEVDKRQFMEDELVAKAEMIMKLEGNIEMLNDQPDATKLLAAMESDKIAASRAVEQNQKLKEQLEELHRGFIKMSNSKLELTEKLQSEQHLTREISEKLEQRNSAIEHLHSVIATKDVQLTDVHNQSTELQKQILQQSQLSDRLRHYEAQGSTSDYIQQELQQTKHTVIKLTAENETLRTEIEKMAVGEHNKIEDENLTLGKTQTEVYSVENNETLEIENVKKDIFLKEKINTLEKINAELQKQLKEINENSELNLVIKKEEEKVVFSRDADVNTKLEARIDKEKAMEQLEERFKNTMIDVANLTEEKQKLEHLVLQLQSETETIGEYVALYQCQRAVLNEKALEKDEQLKRLAHDREEMNYKLEQLNGLIQRLVVEKGIISKDVLLNLHHDSCKAENDVNKLKFDAEDKKDNVNGGKHDNNNVDGTAGKIIALLSEIKTSNLVHPGDSIQNFHPCPLCSGQLITV